MRELEKAFNPTIGQGMATAQREPQLRTTISKLSDRMEQLDSAISSLTNRLAPVCRPEDTGNESGQGLVPRPYYPEAIQLIENQIDSLETHIGRLRDLINRLEV